MSQRVHSLKWFLAGQTSAASLSFLMYRVRQQKRLEAVVANLRNNSRPPWQNTPPTSPIQKLRMLWLGWLIGQKPPV